MKKRNRFLLLLTVLAIVATLAGCSRNTTTLKVGATAVPHAEILEFAKPILAKQGVNLEIVVFNDYVKPNRSLDQGEIAANFFQHIPYLEAFNQDHQLNLVALAKVHIEPIGIYSNKYTGLDQLPQKAQIAIPNDVSQVGRSLALLAKAGLIELRADVGIRGTVQDITSNPRELQITLLDAATLPRVLDDPKVSAAVINGNFALEAGINPVEDALLLEDGDSPYANVLVVKKGSENDSALQKLKEVLQSDAVKQFIEEKYEGAVIPV